MNRQWLARIVKWVGVISAVGMLILWLVLLSDKQAQYEGQGIPAGTWRIGGWRIDAVDVEMTALSLAAVVTALGKKPLLMALVFLLIFWPVGFYLLGVPSWARLFGILNLVYLAAGLLLLTAHDRIVKTENEKI